MVAWNVDEARVEQVGTAMAGFDEITHCYRRDPAPGWPYNLYTMVHAGTEAECLSLVEKIAATVGETDYTLLFSRKELKKTSMKYFED
jgi:DNA-binding Lrp family transcriptional regulator